MSPSSALMARSGPTGHTAYGKHHAWRWPMPDAQPREIMAISGHSSLAQVQIYIAEAEQKRLAQAAMAKRTGTGK